MPEERGSRYFGYMETGVIILAGFMILATIVLIVGVFVYAFKTRDLFPMSKLAKEIVAEAEEKKENERKMRVYSDLVKVIKKKEEKRCS